MEELKLFNNPEFGTIRVISIEDEPWLVGKDVAQALGYTDTDQALRRHVDDEDKLTRNFDGSGQNRSMTIINESGLYSLVLSSKLPTARKFPPVGYGRGSAKHSQNRRVYPESARIVSRGAYGQGAAGSPKNFGGQG